MAVVKLRVFRSRGPRPAARPSGILHQLLRRPAESRPVGQRLFISSPHPRQRNPSLDRLRFTLPSFVDLLVAAGRPPAEHGGINAPARRRRAEPEIC
jgi:hypothetical protein